MKQIELHFLAEKNHLFIYGLQCPFRHWNIYTKIYKSYKSYSKQVELHGQAEWNHLFIVNGQFNVNLDNVKYIPFIQYKLNYIV